MALLSTPNIMNPFEESQRNSHRLCAFEKAVQTDRCHCSHAQRFLISEREGMACLSHPAHQRCLQLFDLLQEKSCFIFQRRVNDQSPLPMGQRLRFSLGGLLALHKLLNQTEEPLPDVNALLDQANSQYGQLTDWPFESLIQSISHFKARKKHR
jgi:hypothetical protein